MRVLVTLDGSKFAEVVLGPAANLTGTSNAEVHLIQVVKHSEAGTTRAKTGVGVPHSPGEMRLPGELGGTIPKGVGGTAVEPGVPAEEQSLRQAEEYLADVAARFFPEGAVRKVVVGRNPAEEIASYASREKGRPDRDSHSRQDRPGQGDDGERCRRAAEGSGGAPISGTSGGVVLRHFRLSRPFSTRVG